MEEVAPLSEPGAAPAGEHLEPVHWEAARPLFEISGPFQNHVVNLRDLGLSDRLGGAFSLMVSFEMDDINPWARLFDFSVAIDDNGVGIDSISVGIVDIGYDLHFTITQGLNARSVHGPDFFMLGKPATVLFTVSDSGHMKIWQDGELVAENPRGHIPNYVERPHLTLGGHHVLPRQNFKGRLYDVRIWNREVLWGDRLPSDEDADPVDHLGGLAGPWHSVEPLLNVAGPFSEESPGDLGELGLSQPVGGAFSLMITVLLDEAVPWSRVFDFCVVDGIEHIGAGMVGEGRGISFTVSQGNSKASIFADDFFPVGIEVTALFTVSDTGRMKLYKDGALVRQKDVGKPLNYLKRPYMNIGSHYSHEGQGFRGLIRDVKLWSAEVTWSEDSAPPETASELGDAKEATAWEDVEPIFQTEGPFNGSNPGDLVREGFRPWLSGAFSIMATIRMDESNTWSRVFDFCVSEDNQAISVGSNWDSYDMFFNVMRGGETATVFLPDFFILEYEFTALFSVSSEGHMKVYVDGELHGENENGLVPEHVKRPHLRIGNHFSWTDQGFRGSIRDVKIWDREVAWDAKTWDARCVGARERCLGVTGA